MLGVIPGSQKGFAPVVGYPIYIKRCPLNAIVSLKTRNDE
jgi:hypothetical protein